MFSYNSLSKPAFALVGAIAFGIVGLGGSAVAGPHDPVSSDGTVTKLDVAAARAATFAGGVRAFAGRGAPVTSAADASGAAAPASSFVSPSVVIGPDGRTRVNPTTTFPYRAVVQISFKKTVGGPTFGCTGWMISADTLATAGHCVHKGSGGATGFYPISTYVLVPGANATAKPYGTCTARRLHTVKGWSENGSSNFDYAAIKLNCRVGNTTGWFGYYWQTATLTGTAATITGYPCDKPSGTQWTMSGSIASTSDRRVSYTIDTFGCQSGSPVWRVHPTFGRAGMAVHTNGSSSANSGTRIVKAVADNFQAWRTAP